MYKANRKKMKILEEMNRKNNKILEEMKKSRKIIKRSNLSLKDKLDLLKI